MTKRLLRHLVWCFTGVFLVSLQIWRSSNLFLGDSASVVPLVPLAAAFAATQDNTTHVEAPLAVDILSIASNHRPEYWKTQRDTFARHSSVRYFVAATQTNIHNNNNNNTTTCESTIDRKDAEQIVQFCKIKVEKTENISLYTQGSIAQRLRARFAGWYGFLENKEHPEGWLCAQRRPSEALIRLFKWYQTNDVPLPDYLILMDDDTYVDLAQVLRYLQALYDNPQEPLVMAGCLIRFLHKFPEFMSIPFGGWGTILNRRAIQNMLRPMDCDGNDKMDEFTTQSCRQLQRNLVHERVHYRRNMSLLELMEAFTMQSFESYRNWNETHNFCWHSDWLSGYFWQYYPVGALTGHDLLPGKSRNETVAASSRMTSYRRSEQIAGKLGLGLKKRLALEGQCRFQGQKCTPDNNNAHICHYMTPDLMVNMSESLQRKQRAQSRYDLSPWLSHSTWNAVWMRKASPKTSQLPVTLRSPQRPTDDKKSVPVFVYPFMSHAIEHELKHFVWEGIRESNSLTWSENGNETSTWIIDAHRAGLRSPRYCARVARLVAEALRYKEKDPALLAEWKVVFMYWDDEPLDDFLDCFRVTRLVDSLRVYRYKRSMVSGRRWNSTLNFVEPGAVVTHGNWREHASAPVRHMNYGVRNDIVQGIRKLLYKDELDQHVTDEEAGRKLIFEKNRPVEVSYFWPRRGEGDKLVTRGLGSELRDAVSDALLEFSKTFADPDRIYVGLSGEADDAGRNVAQVDYLRQMISSKVVVVAQKDRWEDHYRLMEALASGALVFTDPMLSLPTGLKDGESIVVYNTLTELSAKLSFYLRDKEERERIAFRGYQVAMERHQSWKIMERIVLDDLVGNSVLIQS